MPPFFREIHHIPQIKNGQQQAGKGNSDRQQAQAVFFIQDHGNFHPLLLSIAFDRQPQAVLPFQRLQGIDIQGQDEGLHFTAVQGNERRRPLPGSGFTGPAFTGFVIRTPRRHQPRNRTPVFIKQTGTDPEQPDILLWIPHIQQEIGRRMGKNDAIAIVPFPRHTVAEILP